MARRKKFDDRNGNTIAAPQERRASTQPAARVAPSRVVPDWRAYFLQSFIPQHGGEPIDDGFRLIFRDGWAYSRTDYRGPEYPPPKRESEVKAIQLEYWTRRRAIVSQARDVLFESVRVMHETTKDRSAPMMQEAHQSVQANDGRSYMVRAAHEVDFTILEIEMDQANKDVEECDRQIKLLTAEMLI